MTKGIEEKNKIEDNKKGKELISEELKEDLGECRKLKDEYLSGWQRERADFLNYKKEEMERIGGFFKYAGEEFVLKILPILDNFETAKKKLPQGLKNDENVRGVLQIKEQIKYFLEGQGVKEIRCLGEKFDPNFMEAVGEVESASAEVSADAEALADKSAGKSGMVVEEIQKGYKMQGRLLRAAKVKVTK